MLKTTFIALIKNTAALLAMTLFSLAPASSNAQSVTNIDMTSTVIQQGVERLGMNIGAHNFYDSGQLTQNLVFRNPGFEPQIFQSMIRCATGTATTCTDDDAWSGWPADFWKGATFEMVFGTSKGRTGTITTSSACANGNGVVFTFNGSGTSVAAGDYMIVRLAIAGNPGNGWWTSTNGNATLTPETVDLPPGTAGVQAQRVTSPTSSDSASVSQYFDSQTQAFVQLNGQFDLTFKAKGTAGNNTLQVVLFRNGGPNWISQTINLTGSWNTYNLTFTANENGTSVGAVNLNFNAAGPTGFLLDDVALTQTNGSSSNPTAYRDAVVNALKQYAPGTIRYWDNQLGESLDNWIAPPFGRKPANYSAWSTSATDISVGLHEFLQLCQTVGADPWIVVPLVFDSQQASNLIEYLSGPQTSTYGAKRAARGQTTPWTSVFKTIHLELGNEAWNSGFKGGGMEYGDAYGTYSNTIFGAMRANPNYVPSAYDLIVGGQTVYLARNQQILSYANQQDTFTVAGYLYGQVDTFATDEELYGPLFAEPEEDNAAAGIVGQNRPLFPKMATYELNLSTEAGAITQARIDQLTPSVAAGLTVADHMLMQMRDLGVHPINIWQLGQYSLSLSDGEFAPLFGAVVDMGVTDRRRPQFLAAALANTVIGGNMIQAIQSGANPTWNQPLSNGVQLSAAHYIQSYAFSDGSTTSVILFNLHRTDSLQVTFSDVNAPSGTVSVQQLTSGNINDGNETGQVVGVTKSQLTGFNPSSPYSLPPFSMTVLTWQTSVEVSVTPESANLEPSASQQLTATVANSTNQAVVWKISPAVGTLSSTGIYTAPATVTSPQTVMVTATSSADPTKSGSATITVSPAVAVSLLPTTVTLTASQSKQFTASVRNTSNSTVNWLISPSIGTISITGLYTAPSVIAAQTTVTITAVSVASSGAFASGTITLSPSGGAFNPIAINVAGSAYTDSNGLKWTADAGYTGGAIYTVPNAIANSNSQPLYQTQRFEDCSYNFSVPNGTYKLTLKFAELYWTKPGQRVFNILVNGNTAVSNFDIFAAAGANFTAFDKVIVAQVTTGSLTLAFKSVVNYAAINAIEITKLTPVSVSPTTASIRPGQTQQFTASGGTSASYKWSLSPGIGTISSTGLYTAPSTLTGSQTVTISVTDATGSSSAVATVTVGTPSPIIAVNAGGAAFTDPTGLVWSADSGFTGGTADLEDIAITNTTTPALYKSNRWGMTAYNFKVANGTYNVTLKFAETYFTQPGQRVFNVTANGTPVLTNFDLFAAAGGQYLAVDKTFQVTVTNGQINLGFTAVVNNALVSAIEVTPN